MKRTISELKKISYDELIEKINNQNNAIDHITKLLVNQQIITKQLLETIDKQDKIIQKHSNDMEILKFNQNLFLLSSDKQNQIINEIIDQINKITTCLFY